MPVTMYHNPRCNTSRRTLALLREKSVAGIKALLLSKRQSVRSLYWHEHRSALVLDQEHHEFRRLGPACVPANDMNIVGAFIEGLSCCQRYLFPPLHLHHDGALQYVNNRM